MSWCWGHRGEQHKRLFRELSLPRASWCGWRRTLELLQPGPGWVSPPVAARESVPSEGGRELSLQDGSARPTAALAGRRQACGRRERQGAGARLGVPDGGGRRGWGRGDRGTLWLQIRGGGESGREAGRRLPATTPHQQPPTQCPPRWPRAGCKRDADDCSPASRSAGTCPHPRSPSSRRHRGGVTGSRAGSSRPGFRHPAPRRPPRGPQSRGEGGGQPGPTCARGGQERGPGGCVTAAGRRGSCEAARQDVSACGCRHPLG